MKPPQEYLPKLTAAVERFWNVKTDQKTNQGAESGLKDYGNRGSVTGGKHLDGFSSLFTDIILECGVPMECIHVRTTTIPGYFRPTKEWDLLVIMDQRLVAVMEFKSHVGSFGNNFNNRVEEALGNATDLWTAYREKVLHVGPRPWTGYFMLLQKNEKSYGSTTTREPHFRVESELRNASYKDRYRIFCERLMLERLYDAACLVASETDSSTWEEPSDTTGFVPFVSSLQGRLTAEVARMSGSTE